MMFVGHPEEDSLWAFGRLLERAASPQLGWFPRNYVDPVDEITRREGSEPPHSGTLSDPSTRVSDGCGPRHQGCQPEAREEERGHQGCQPEARKKGHEDDEGDEERGHAGCQPEAL